MSSPTPTAWAVICPEHGKVYLTEEEYAHQLNLADSFWKCPVLMTDHPRTLGPCGANCDWDDDNYDAWEEAGGPPP